MPLSRSTRVGHYEITAKLGEGGMGEVYLATDSKLQRQVAIKVLPESLAANAERLARFEREARLLAQLNHRNIAAIYGVEETKGVRALVMELVEGPTLADRLREGAVPLQEALTIARQMADALEAAHEKGIMHRDLKPANVKLRPDGVVKVLDFGLAKTAEPAAGSDPNCSSDITVGAATAAGAILGTASYMAPEQARGKSVDKRADIWAFGVVLYEMLTGRQPFEGETISDTLVAVLTREPDLDEVPASARRLVRRCLEKDRTQRLRDIGDAMALVEADSTAAVSPAKAKRYWLWPAVAALLAVAVTVTTWLWLLPPAVVNSITRFYVDAPTGTAFNYTYTGTAISPDGRALVFRVASGTGASSLWLRPLDSLTARPLAGTEGGDFPFWSPDNQSIGFFAAGKLKRVDVGGGTPLTLCDATATDTAMTGASWSRVGIIIFGGADGLRRVAASGGVPVLLARVRGSRQETGHGFPQFLPDGRRFLYFIRSRDLKNQGVYASSLERPQDAVQIHATDRKAIYVPDAGRGSGYLLYTQEQTLLARRFDPDTRRLVGDPSPVTAEVALFPPGFHASFWASESGVLAYRTGASDAPRLTWMSMDGKRQSETGTEDFYTHVRLSPDHTRAAVELADRAGNLDIWIWDFARRVKTRQTFDVKADRYPVWSPDGRQIAFSSARSGVLQVYRKNVDGGGQEEQLTTGLYNKSVSDWSRDGRHLLFVETSQTTSEDIWALPLEGSRQPFAFLKTVFIETNPVFSPDEKWVAFETTESGRPEVYVQQFLEAQNPRGASGGARWQVSNQGGSRPRWRGDGKELFYVGLNNSAIMAAAIRTVGAGIEIDAPRSLFEIPVMPEVRSPYDVVADGRRVLLLERTVSQSTPLVVVMNWQAGLNQAR